MKWINRFRIFFKFVWRNSRYEGVDPWHLWKYRLSISTAWELVKLIAEPPKE